MKNAIKIGLILTAISVIGTLIMTSLLDAKTIFSGSYMWGSTGISLVILVLLGRHYLRPKDYQGLTYGEALKYLFVSVFLYYSVSQVTSILFYGNSSEIKEAFTEYAVDSQISARKMGMKIAGADEMRIENDIDEFKEQIESGEIPLPDYPFSWSNLPMNLLMSSIMGLIFSMIAAIFVKQKG